LSSTPATQASQAPQESRSRSGWRATLTDPALVAVAVYTVVALGAMIAAYLTVFTVWAGYDDEGTLLVTLQAFAHGDTLYTDIYTPYGPFYYELFGGLLALTGEAVTNDLSRTTVAVLWVITSLLVGIASQRLSGNLALGASGMIIAFTTLHVLANEPMHPQVLCVLLLGAFVLLAAFGPGKRPLWAGAAGGALLAALVLTKVNLGVYAVAAVVLAAALTLEPLRARRWLGWPAIAAVLVMPAFVVSRELSEAWGRELVALETLALGAIAVAAWPLGSRRDGAEDGSLNWLLGAAVGFAVAFVAILVAIALTGAPLGDVYDGVITEAMRVRDVNMSPFQMAPAAIDWAIAAFAGAVLFTWLRRTVETTTPSIWPGLLRAVAGLVVWFSVAKLAPIGLNPSPGQPVILPAVLAWIAVIPPTAGEPSYKRFLRVLLPALGVAEMLQVYPVPGSQVGIAAFCFVPLGALLLSDALVSLRQWGAARGGRVVERVGIVIAVATVALAADFAMNFILRSIQYNAPIYNERQEAPAALKGASQLRLPDEDIANYTHLVGWIKEYDCTNFVGYPNVNSLYLWTGIEPPPPAAPGAWIEAMDAERQRRVVRELSATARPCAIRNEGLAGSWLGGAEPPKRPLENYVLNRFRPVEEIGPFQFMLPVGKGSRRQAG